MSRLSDNYPPGVTWRDFWGDEEEREETEPDDFEEYYCNLRTQNKKRGTAEMKDKDSFLKSET
ncbi:MAG: hypothetical protein ACOX3P_03765 [Saccharofermentanales bacterium]|jgi:hypothetical protein|nr:hypothetical protein [Clostridiales bacterium]